MNNELELTSAFGDSISSIIDLFELLAKVEKKKDPKKMNKFERDLQAKKSVLKLEFEVAAGGKVNATFYGVDQQNKKTKLISVSNHMKLKVVH